MSDALRFVPPRVALVDQRTGTITREWYLFFQGIFDRIGGATGESTTDISQSLFEDAGTSEVDARIRSLDEAMSQAPVYAESKEQEVIHELHELRAEVDTLRQQVQSLMQGTLL